MLIMWALLISFLIGSIYSYVFMLGHKREYARIMCGQDLPSENEVDIAKVIEDFRLLKVEKPVVKDPDTPYAHITMWIMMNSLFRHILLVTMILAALLFTRSLFFYEIFGFAIGFWGFIIFDHWFIDQQRNDVVNKCIENGSKAAASRLLKHKEVEFK
jgi:hypothetical protein